MSLQLPFEFGLHAPPHSFDNYVLGENHMVYHVLQQVIHGETEHSVFIWGEPGCGKTHLLEAACQQVSEEGGTPVYLPLAQMAQYPAEVVQGLSEMSLVCLDDVHAIAGRMDWEEALFGLFNRLRESATPLLISAHHPPNQIGLALPDLSSRLSWGGVFALQVLDTAHKTQVLQQYAEELGLEISADVAAYLLKHCSQNLKDLIDCLDLVDYASLATKRKVNLSFVRSVFDGSLEYPARP